ncbi:MAG: sigma-70 family RNA polymerase sigma factor [Bacteroidota bacterium]
MDQQLLDGLLSHRKGSIAEIRKRALPMILELVQKNSGGREDGKDIFQQALIELYRLGKKSDFVLRSKITTLLYGIAKNLWMNELKKRKREVITSDFLDTSKDELIDWRRSEEEEEEHLRITLVKAKISQLTGGCQQILQLYYAEGATMEEIAKELELGGAQAARVKKSRCLSKLKELVLGIKKSAKK